MLRTLEQDVHDLHAGEVMSSSTLLLAHTMPKLPVHAHRLDVPLNKLPQEPQDSFPPARVVLLCLAGLPLNTGDPRPLESSIRETPLSAAAQLRRRYLPIIRKVSARNSGRDFLQLDRRISMVIDLQATLRLPLMQG